MERSKQNYILPLLSVNVVLLTGSHGCSALKLAVIYSVCPSIAGSRTARYAQNK